MSRLLVVIICLVAVPVWVSDPLPDDQVTAEDIRQAMQEAKDEYEAVLKSRERVLVQEEADAVSLSPERTGAEQELITELATQVSLLRSRLAIERATVASTQSAMKVKVSGSRTVFNYRENGIYEVMLATDYVTDIQLKAGESLTSPPSAGDTVRWNIGVMKSDNGKEETTHIILKPTEDNIRTNLIITTDQHVYHLVLRSGATHMPAVIWNYPEDNFRKIELAKQKKRVSERVVALENLCFDYEITGDRVSWRPERVFDDGKKTFIQMPTDFHASEAPALFILGDDEMQLVNYRVKGRYYVVDRLFERARLLVGKNERVDIEREQDSDFFDWLF